MNNSAKYYIYRNLNKSTESIDYVDRGCWFSLKYRGNIIGHFTSATVKSPSFKVNEKSRLRAVNSGQRNVHAYIVCDEPPELINVYISSIWEEYSEFVKPKNKITYNPFDKPYFFDSRGNRVDSCKPGEILLLNSGSVYRSNKSIPSGSKFYKRKRCGNI